MKIYVYDISYIWIDMVSLCWWIEFYLANIYLDFIAEYKVKHFFFRTELILKASIDNCWQERSFLFIVLKLLTNPCCWCCKYLPDCQIRPVIEKALLVFLWLAKAVISLHILQWIDYLWLLLQPYSVMKETGTYAEIQAFWLGKT